MNNIKINKTDNLGYKGSVTVKLMKGKKVIKQKTCHNQGRWPIFKFLAYALSGDYSVADAERPFYIEVFSVKSEDGNIPEITEVRSAKIADYTNEENRVTKTTIAYRTRPKVDYTQSNKIGKGSVTYTFSIPFVLLALDDQSTNWGTWYNTTNNYTITPLNLVALYSKNNHNTDTPELMYNNPSAYFFVSDSNNKMGSLLPKSIGANLSDYNLLIEWKLSLN